MTRSRVSLVLLALLIMAGAAMSGEHESKWLDPANCHFCQPLVEDPALLENLNWSNYNIATGVVSVTTYKPQFKESYEKANAAMMKRWEEMDPEKEYYMCGMCDAYSRVPYDKVTMEHIDFEGGQVGLMTTEDPDVLKQLHDITDRTNQEYEKMMKAGTEAN